MKRKIHTLIVSLLLLLGVLSPAVVNAAVPCTLYTAPALEVFVPWYKYLPGDRSTGRCRPALPQKSEVIRNGNGPNKDKTVTGTDIGKSAVLILIAIIELLTRIAGLVAVGFIIYGAIQYITSQGEPEGLSNAKNTITNSIIGFVITVLAIAIVQFIGRALSY